MTEAADAIRVQDGRLRLSEQVVLNIEDWRVPTGERVAVTGPSGCGKSSLLHLVSGLLPPDGGKVEVLGLELTGLKPRVRDRFRGREMGFVYQTFNLLPHFTPRENVLIGLRFGRTVPRAERASRAADVLERVGLSHRADQRVDTLSIGEQQRVAIARALANRPRLLLADEPTGSLDPENGRRVFDLLNELATDSGSTLVLVTHDRELAQEMPAQFDARGLIAS